MKPQSVPVVTFRTPDHSYLYDAATHHIARLPEPAARMAESFYRGELGGELPWRRFGLPPASYRKALAFLEALRRETGVCQPQRPETVIAPRSTERVAAVPRSLYALTLNVTEACNLRCAYCIFGGAYPGRRTHGRRVMRWNVACAAIDFLAAHSGDAAKPYRSLGWYGGEPLLAFPLIRRSAGLFRSTFPDREVRFHLTTNATVWNDETIDFLAEEDVELMVSLDGPEEIHDRGRRTRAGAPTHERVMAFLERLRTRHPDYFSHRVALNAVAVPPVDLAALDRFFSGLPLVVQLTAPVPASFAPEAPGQVAGWQEVREKFIRGCLERRFDTPAFKREGYGFIHGLFARDLARIHRRRVRPGFESEVSTYGCCVPGFGQIFVGIEGTLEVCEKTEGTPWMVLGDLAAGFRPEAVREIQDRFEALERPDCGSCFNVRLCPVCFAHPLHEGRLDAGKLAWHCDRLRARTREMLALYCEILEADPAALDFLAPAAPVSGLAPPLPQ